MPVPTKENKDMNKMDELMSRYPQLEVCKADITAALDLLRSMYHAGGKLLCCGNGGSCGCGTSVQNTGCGCGC